MSEAGTSRLVTIIVHNIFATLEFTPRLDFPGDDNEFLLGDGFSFEDVFDVSLCRFD
jgi:hypothetical protein